MFVALSENLLIWLVVVICLLTISFIAHSVVSAVAVKMGRNLVDTLDRIGETANEAADTWARLHEVQADGPSELSYEAAWALANNYVLAIRAMQREQHHRLGDDFAVKADAAEIALQAARDQGANDAMGAGFVTLCRLLNLPPEPVPELSPHAVATSIN